MQSKGMNSEREASVLLTAVIRVAQCIWVLQRSNESLDHELQTIHPGMATAGQKLSALKLKLP